jgi:hypothetical protein
MYSVAGAYLYRRLYGSASLQADHDERSLH